MQIGYWARMEGDPSAAPTAILGEATPEDAAGAYAQRLIEQSEGGWTEGAIRVWGSASGEGDAIIFDVTAQFMVNDDDEDMIDCELEIIARD